MLFFFSNHAEEEMKAKMAEEGEKFRQMLEKKKAEKLKNEQKEKEDQEKLNF